LSRSAIEPAQNHFHARSGRSFGCRGEEPVPQPVQTGPKERAYLEQKTLSVVLEHGRQFLGERLAPAAPRNDGRQTPMRGHPVFIAQHATATCCRGCLAKWHHIPAGSPLTDAQIDYVLCVIGRWLAGKTAGEPHS
jgi:hypothetical protein